MVTTRRGHWWGSKGGSSSTETGTPDPSDSRRASRGHPDGEGQGRESDRGTGGRDMASRRARAGGRLVGGPPPGPRR